MKRCVSLFAVMLAVGTALLTAAETGSQSGPAQGSGVLLLQHANVIDGVSPHPLRDATVLIDQGRIAQVTIGKVELPAGATLIDLKGRWLLPGFVDAHVHIRDLPAARRALASGTTTARSMGVAHFVDVGMRELNHAGAVDLPDLLAAGYHVRPDLDENLFVDAPQLRDLMGRKLSGADSLRRVARMNLARGANVIKVLATERAGLPETDPRKRTFTEEELAAVVEEARKANVPVAAHAHGDEGAAAAVRAGVRTIEHGTYVSEATLSLMKEHGACLDPTIATVVDLTQPGGDYDNAALAIRGRAMLPRIREATAQAWRMGVKVIAGTDTAYGPASDRRIAHEVAELAALGMPPMEAIRAATSVAAECLGVGKRVGTVQAGLEADLIVVERDPLADLTALGDVLVVINNGRVALDRTSR